MKRLFSIGILGLTLSLSVILMSAKEDDVITKENGTTIVNTLTLSKRVKGYKGTTPLKIYIKKDKIVKIEPLQNQESPQYFNQAKKLLTSYEGKSVAKVVKQNVDGVTGATLSSNALIKNVNLGIEYYLKNK